MPTPNWKEKTHTIAIFKEDHAFIEAEADKEDRSLIRQVHHWIERLRKGEAIRAVTIKPKKT